VDKEVERRVGMIGEDIDGAELDGVGVVGIDEVAGFEDRTEDKNAENVDELEGRIKVDAEGAEIESVADEIDRLRNNNWRRSEREIT
jgi:hypothetical protein